VETGEILGGHMAHTEVDGEEPSGRWQRSRRAGGAGRLAKILVLILVVPILLGVGVALVAGRPLAFAVVHRMTTRKFPEVKWIDAAELARWREDSARRQPLILDARSAPEFAMSHLRDAIWINPARPSLHPLKGLPKDAPVVVYGSVGYRGARVAYWLSSLGYSNVQNLSGGLFQWANQGLPVFRGGQPTAEVHPYTRRWGLLLESPHRAPAADVEPRFAAP
jgi:rhodanese-related sulfurtransferase